MLQIRKSFFETNSSSCHVFIYNPNDDTSIPSTVSLNIDCYDTILDIIFNDIYGWYKCGIYDKEMCTFIDMLLSSGVKNIKCEDKQVTQLIKDRQQFLKNNSFSGCLFGYTKNEIIQVLFGANTKKETVEDYILEQYMEEEYKDYKYIAYRLS